MDKRKLGGLCAALGLALGAMGCEPLAPAPGPLAPRVAEGETGSDDVLGLRPLPAVRPPLARLIEV